MKRAPVLALLRRLEWRGPDYSCPDCKALHREGHAPGCELAAMLTSPAGVKAAQRRSHEGSAGPRSAEGVGSIPARGAQVPPAPVILRGIPSAAQKLGHPQAISSAEGARGGEAPTFSLAARIAADVRAGTFVGKAPAISKTETAQVPGAPAELNGHGNDDRPLHQLDPSGVRGDVP